MPKFLGINAALPLAVDDPLLVRRGQFLEGRVDVHVATRRRAQEIALAFGDWPL